MADIMRPTVDISELIPDFLPKIVADAIARGMSEEDIRLWLGSLARDEYRKQVGLPR
ncbi:hypothetical protein JW921_05985 [Candidatus Fermentibacterales bacterium]|nr:hypothetical protein [Candidatus Fermentibacterales bacterium]